MSAQAGGAAEEDLERPGLGRSQAGSPCRYPSLVGQVLGLVKGCGIQWHSGCESQLLWLREEEKDAAGPEKESCSSQMPSLSGVLPRTPGGVSCQGTQMLAVIITGLFLLQLGSFANRNQAGHMHRVGVAADGLSPRVPDGTCRRSRACALRPDVAWRLSWG